MPTSLGPINIIISRVTSKYRRIGVLARVSLMRQFSSNILANSYIFCCFLTSPQPLIKRSALQPAFADWHTNLPPQKTAPFSHWQQKPQLFSSWAENRASRLYAICNSLLCPSTILYVKVNNKLYESPFLWKLWKFLEKFKSPDQDRRFCWVIAPCDHEVMSINPVF